MNIYCCYKIFGWIEKDLEEEGGIILVNKEKDRLIPYKLENKSDCARKTYKFDILELQKILDENPGAEIAYFWHTHPHEETKLVFSEEDKKFAESWGVPSVLFDKNTKNVNVYMPKSREIKELVGRKFLVGYHDCISLVVDYFALNGKEIPFFCAYQKKDIEKEFISQLENVYNFKEAVISDIQKDDVIIQFDKGIFRHILIYAGDNNVIHQKMNCDSNIENIYEQKTLDCEYKIYRKQ